MSTSPTPSALRPAAPLPILLTLVVVLPTPALAQFGGLGRRISGAVGQQVEQRVEEELPYARLPAPEFNDRILEINERRLEGLLRGFRAEVEYADRAGDEYEAQVRAYDAAMAEYDRASVAYTAQSETYALCEARFDAQEAEAQAANEAQTQKALEDMGDEQFGVYMEALALRGEALAREIQGSAGAPSDELMRRQQLYIAEVNAMQVEQSRRLQLAMQGYAVEAQRSASEQARLEAACGPKPVQPTMPQSNLTGAEGILSQRGAQAAGLDAEQYAIMRERVAYWMRANGRPTGMGFSDGEMTVLEGQKDDLEDVFDDMRDADLPL